MPPSKARSVAVPFKIPHHPIDRETVIAFEAQTAGGVVYTSDPVVYRDLVAAGFVAAPDPDYPGPGIRFEIDRADIRLPQKAARKSEPGEPS